jgi:protein PhnA
MDIKVRGSNGAQFADGDSVALIRDLKLKGSSTVLKRGTVIKNIHLTDDPTKSKAAPARSRAWCSARRF